MENDAVAALYSALVALNAPGQFLEDIAKIFDHNIEPIKDLDYPAITVDWVETEKLKFTGNIPHREFTLVASLFVAESDFIEARKRLRALVWPFQQALWACRALQYGGKTFIFRPGKVRSGDRKSGDGTWTAGAVCPVQVQTRGH